MNPDCHTRSWSRILRCVLRLCSSETRWFVFASDIEPCGLAIRILQVHLHGDLSRIVNSHGLISSCLVYNTRRFDIWIVCNHSLQWAGCWRLEYFHRWTPVNFTFLNFDNRAASSFTWLLFFHRHLRPVNLIHLVQLNCTSCCSVEHVLLKFIIADLGYSVVSFSMLVRHRQN